MTGDDAPEAGGQFLIEDLEDLYENAPCGYLSMGPNGRIFKTNKTLATWIGIPPAEILGKGLGDLLTVGSHIFYETNYAPLLVLQGFFNGVSVDLKTANGDKLPVFASGLERREIDGSLLFTRLTIFKATERRRYERELVDARAAAEITAAQSRTLVSVTQDLLKIERENSNLREQFIAVLGHDLRNPLASISSGTILLLKDPQTERAKRVLGMMQGSVARMALLIDNVLDFARGRLSDGIAVDMKTEVLLEPVLQQVIAELRIGASNHEIIADIAIAKPVKCDPVRIGQMASNLIGNALTHGAIEKPVHVHGELSDGEIVIWVANSGNRISPQAMERLFQPFFRGEVRPGQQGLGLGLHIASEIAKAHRGTLTVDSSDAETRFTFRMPGIQCVEKS